MKYYKDWEQIKEENNDCPAENVEPMKKKMTASENAVFSYVINLLL